ncbi:hypothetical protein [Streptomyces sp. NPDC051016]|uniref:hypothetical protein n=1 Tax=Streptomyces sp. NPDC051016 TaxID=3365638 RepID=UPI0037B63FDC
MSLVHRRFAAAVALLECLVLGAVTWFISGFATAVCDFDQADGRNLDQDCGSAGPGMLFYGVVLASLLVLVWNSAVLAFDRVAGRFPGRVVAAGLAAAALLQAAAALYAVMSLVRDAAGGLPLYLIAECAALAGAGYVLAVTGREAMRRL